MERSGVAKGDETKYANAKEEVKSWIEVSNCAPQLETNAEENHEAIHLKYACRFWFIPYDKAATLWLTQM